ncbi:MAG: hypothetical protein JSS60_02005, partial [Verrucomicrobia bacterium]|nr:hypothetical protein [Verrucomicrobiota bacterium]
MSSNVSASDVRNVHIHSRRDRDIALCRSHREQLGRDISGDINDLVATTLFQAHFNDFLPPHEDDEIDVNIHVTEDTITVRSLDGRTKTIALDDLHEDISEVEEINAEIIRKANGIYRECMDDTHHASRSHSSLRGRASTREFHTHERGRSHSPVRTRHTHSLSPVSSRRAHRRDDTTRREHDLSVDAQAKLLREEAERLRRQSASNPRLAEKLARVEEKLRALEQKLGIPTPVTPPELEARIDALFDRLERVETQIDILKAPRPVPETTLHTEELQRLRQEKTELESRLSQVSSENEVLKARLATPPPDISDDHFDRLITISENLATDINKSSTTFPADLQAEFNMLPETVRNAIYYQTYLLVDPTGLPNPWQVGEKLFQGQPVQGTELSAQNLCRSHSIRYYLLHALATEFAKSPGDEPSQKLLDRFNRLPKEDREWVLIQLQFVQQRKGGDDTLQTAHDAFYGLNSKTATNQERSAALVRSLLERVAEYHRHNFQTKLRELEHIYSEAFEKFQAHTSAQIQHLSLQNSDLEQQLMAATSSLRLVEQERDDLRSQLSSKTLELTQLQERFRQANDDRLLEVQRLTQMIRQGTEALEQLRLQKQQGDEQNARRIQELETNVRQGTEALEQLRLQKQQGDEQNARRIQELETNVRQGTEALEQLRLQKQQGDEQNARRIQELETNVRQGAEALEQLRLQKQQGDEQNARRIQELETNVRQGTEALEQLRLQKQQGDEQSARRIQELETNVRQGTEALEQLRLQKQQGDEKSARRIQELETNVRQGTEALDQLRRDKQQGEEQSARRIQELETNVRQGTEALDQLR